MINIIETEITPKLARKLTVMANLNNIDIDDEIYQKASYDIIDDLIDVKKTDNLFYYQYLWDFNERIFNIFYDFTKWINNTVDYYILRELTPLIIVLPNIIQYSNVLSGTGVLQNLNDLNLKYKVLPPKVRESFNISDFQIIFCDYMSYKNIIDNSLTDLTRLPKAVLISAECLLQERYYVKDTGMILIPKYSVFSEHKNITDNINYDRYIPIFDELFLKNKFHKKLFDNKIKDKLNILYLSGIMIHI